MLESSMSPAHQRLPSQTPWLLVLVSMTTKLNYKLTHLSQAWWRKILCPQPPKNPSLQNRITKLRTKIISSPQNEHLIQTVVETHTHVSPVTEYGCQFRNRMKIFAFPGRHLGGDSDDGRARSNSQRLQSPFIVLENAGSTSCSHGNAGMSRALSSFRDARCGAACELCDAGCICAYASTVWQEIQQLFWG